MAQYSGQIQMSDVAIIGGGPSGVFCAIKLLEYCPDIRITIFDKNDLLKTILVTGNGRCNLTYCEYDNMELAKFYPRGEKFLYSAFARYSVSDTLSDFKKLGIETYIQNDNRIFPISNKSSDVRYRMLDRIKGKVKFIKKEVNELPAGFSKYVLATGLKSGANLAKKLGHNIVELKPSLSGFKTKEDFSSLEGVSFNGIIFTKDGVSGPYIYKLSSYNAYKKYPYEIEITLCNFDELYKKIKNNPKKLVKNVLSGFIPKSLSNYLMKDEIQCGNASKELILSLCALKLTVLSTDNRGEIVHAGGVDLSEIDKNFKSKIKDNLWVIGELLNIDGLTGGFNLQNCWSSASIAAQNIIENLYS